MVGYGMFFGPLIGGNRYYYTDAWVSPILSLFPYLGPNLIASLLSFISIVLVDQFVDETLPEDSRQDYRLIGKDFLQFLRHLPKAPSSLLAGGVERSDDDLGDDLTALEMKDFSETVVLMSTGQARASFSSAMHRKSVVAPLDVEEQDPAVHRKVTAEDKEVPSTQHIEDPEAMTETTPLNQPSGDSRSETSAMAILSQKPTRLYLASYYTNIFNSVAQSEAFPLFAMSSIGGLGMSESSIGLALCGAGLVFCAGQYFVFSGAMARLGLIKCLRYGSSVTGIPVLLIPVSLIFSPAFQMIYLSVVMGGLLLGSSLFCGAVTIGTNRSVGVRQRATLNRLELAGSSLVRAVGPIFAGYLVSNCMKVKWIGGWITYVSLAVAGSLAFMTTLCVPVQDNSKEKRKA
eukprot:scaffold8505_cov130-Cylindrotheca_fusiformis.AAC.4